MMQELGIEKKHQSLKASPMPGKRDLEGFTIGDIMGDGNGYLGKKEFQFSDKDGIENKDKIRSIDNGVKTLSKNSDLDRVTIFPDGKGFPLEINRLESIDSQSESFYDEDESFLEDKNIKDLFEDYYNFIR